MGLSERLRDELDEFVVLFYNTLYYVYIPCGMLLVILLLAV